MNKAPVLLLWFNRPHLSKSQWELIKDYCHEVYIAIDGPRLNKPDEKVKVEACIRLAESIVSYERLLIRDKNLGCGLAVDSAITWFFQNVEQGIILEDDIFPSEDFFNFINELLDYYKDDERIMCISGEASPLTPEVDFLNYSYTFSRFPLISGWGTWKRAWKKYDRNLIQWPEIKKRGDLIGLFNEEDQYNVFFDMFEKIYNNLVPSVWDYQWLATMILESGLAIIPSVNLISNKGFGEDSTHSNNSKDIRANAPTQKLDFPLKHPHYIHPYWKVELDILKRAVGVKRKSTIKKIIKRVFGLPKDRMPFWKRWV